MIRTIVKKLRCIRNGVPLNCDLHRGSKIIKSTIEGRNTIGRHAVIKNSEIGFGSFVSKDSYILNCKIGKYSAVGFESLIGAHPLHKYATIHPAFYSKKGQFGFTYSEIDSFQEYHYVDAGKRWSIVIGNDVWVTASACKIVQGVTIGDGAIVMANAVVTKSVPPYAIVAGIPARIIGYRFSDSQIDDLLKLKWWDMDESWLRSHVRCFDDVNDLIRIGKKEFPERFN